MLFIKTALSKLFSPTLNLPSPSSMSFHRERLKANCHLFTDSTDGLRTYRLSHTSSGGSRGHLQPFSRGDRCLSIVTLSNSQL